MNTKMTKTTWILIDTNQPWQNGLFLNPNRKHVNQRTKTWNVQNIGLNVILLWKHENNKIEIWCKIVPKINVE